MAQCKAKRIIDCWIEAAADMAISKLGEIMAVEFRKSMLLHRLFGRWVVANRTGNKIKRIALKRVKKTI